jgi:glycosyltransferase involved in cell wall biosynthesis
VGGYKQGREIEEATLKILLVGMADSIHLSRWVSQFDDGSFNFEIVSSSPHVRLSTGLASSIRDSPSVTMTWFSKNFSWVMWWLDRFVSDWIRGAFIAWRVTRFKPDIVHVHELQNAGYAVRRAFQLIRRRRPKLLLTNYGSDIYWFSRIPKHLKKIRSLLDMADGYSAECERDYRLAESLSSGFQSMPLMPTAGGLILQPLQNSARYKIAVKGYQNYWGKALVVLEALRGISHDLLAYEIVFFGSDKVLVDAANKAVHSSDLKITTFAGGELSHQNVLTLLGESLIYIGNSLSDGISTSMLEAMSMGAIPIQTCTSCADEWISDKKTGFIVEPNNVDMIREAVLSIVRGNFDADEARSENFKVIENRYDLEALKKIAYSFYQELSYRGAS